VSNGGEGTKGQVPKSIPDRWVNCHNYWRCIHNAPPIKWDKDVAQSAQEWSDTGTSSHSDCYGLKPPYGPAGENMAGGSHMTPEKACDMWHDESPEKGPNCGGHCTAMLWKKSKKLGCGIYKETGGTMFCRYADGPANYGRITESEVDYPDESKKDACAKEWPLGEGLTNTDKDPNDSGGGGFPGFGGRRPGGGSR